MLKSRSSHPEMVYVYKYGGQNPDQKADSHHTQRYVVGYSHKDLACILIAKSKYGNPTCIVRFSLTMRWRSGYSVGVAG